MKARHEVEECLELYKFIGGTLSGVIATTMSAIRECLIDKRDPHKITYPLDIIVITILLAKLCGCNTAKEISKFFKLKNLQLQLIVPGMPSVEHGLSPSTINTVIAMLKYEEIDKFFTEYFSAVKITLQELFTYDDEKYKKDRNNVKDTLAFDGHQPKPGERFTDKVSFDVEGPKAYADLIFDKIEAMASRQSQYVTIAHTPQELYANKMAGRKSIMLGIENGLALEGDVANVAHFKRRGAVYITLCHNGDNNLCDSARGNATHGGVSQLGVKVIEEMNRLGVMVDLSHAAESSFYDALDISRLPIVCSHSSARALCDHPRNLTDDQMRALAAKGGVAP